VTHPPSPGNPFVEHRHQLDTYRAARLVGWSDERWVSEVERLDEQVRLIDGTGFRATPLVRLPGLDGAAVWAKVETANVSGSHKARHLFGMALELAVHEVPTEQPLAIASCGNAALAAATIARAASRPLQVFVPRSADEGLVERLRGLGAQVTSSERQPGTLGDPCVRDLHRALDAGARPFTVQGALCPGTFDGARTLGLELARQLPADDTPRHLFVQIGGGALATATMEGLDRGGRLAGVVLHPVQARAAHPFVAAWERLEAWRLDHPAHGPLPALGDELGPLMVPWPHEPQSVASGILDDITYDWLTVAEWTLRTGGAPVLVDEAGFVDAVAAARTVDPPPDATGAAGLAGLLAARASGLVDDTTEAVVLLTGVDRSWEQASERPRRPVVVAAGA
jgi:threonine synthase